MPDRLGFVPARCGGKRRGAPRRTPPVRGKHGNWPLVASCRPSPGGNMQLVSSPRNSWQNTWAVRDSGKRAPVIPRQRVGRIKLRVSGTALVACWTVRRSIPASAGRVYCARVLALGTGASPPRGGTTDQGREHDQPRGDDALRWRAPASRRPPVPGLCEGDQADGNGPVRQRSDHLRAVSITRPVGRRRHARVSRVRCRVGSSVSNQVTSGMRRSSGQSRTSFPSGRRSNRWSLTLRRDMGGRQCRRLRHRTPPARWCAVGAACATHFVETAHQPPHEAARGEPPHTAGKNPGRTDEAGVDPHYLPMHAVDHTPPIRRGAVCQRSTWRSR